MQKNIILFDGVCKLCNHSVDFILKRDRKNSFSYVALQSEEGRGLLEKFDVPKEIDSVILIKNDRAFLESDAAIEIARMLAAPWKWVAVLRFIPKNFRNGIYRWIAQNRYRWFGKRASCRFIQN